jgi:hypothetical protein
MQKNTQGLGILLLALGAILLLGRFFNLDLTTFGWPFSILLPGLVMLIWAFVTPSAAALAIPGSIVTMVGLIFFYQNATGRFETWSYAWGLIIAAVGLGIALQAVLKAAEEERRDGVRLAMIGFALFVAFGAFFEIFIFRGYSGSFVWRYLLPFALIGGGTYLLLRRQVASDQPPSDLPQSPKPQAQ